MPALVFDECCGCINLKTGCFIIGYLHLIGVSIATFLNLVGVLFGGALMDSAENSDQEDFGRVLVVLLGVSLFFMVLDLAFVIALLVGLHKNKPGHLLAYMIYNVLLMVVQIILISFIFTTVRFTPFALGISLVQTIIFFLLGIYFLLAIRSMYYQMKNRFSGPGYLNFSNSTV